jgi:hypothetical protein
MSTKPSRWLLLLPILAATGACAGGLTRRRTTATDSYCLIAAPLAYDSGKDSAETVAAIEQHNSTWVCLCEQDCPKLKE